ncbi:hypothetical protein CPC08DRAFT_678984 [Agrocybe pediades]|nr:hypothetical protein CPC08DRAFT_678984 [Agrocybe pediades]
MDITSFGVDSSSAAANSSSSPSASQKPSGDSSKPLANDKERPITDIISERFSAFDAQSLIAQPFEDEASRSAKFEKELCDMLLNVLLETHAWARARPKHEATREGRLLEDQIGQIMETEREQGMCSSSPTPSSSSASSYLLGSAFVEQTRQKLGDFVDKMKKALAALTSGI